MVDIRTSNSVVAENLKRFIEEKGIKQKKIAEEAGFTQQELSAMLNGKRIMRAEDIARIIEAVEGLDANTLFKRQEKEDQ